MVRILVVDDEPDACDFLKQFLTLKGYQATTATSGPEALKKVKEERPDLILLDIRMPGMDGIEVLRRVKEVDVAIGVIMITAVKDEEIGKQALQMGANDYITKPLDLEYLETSVLAKIAMMLG